jgi:hypothetical protein
MATAEASQASPESAIGGRLDSYRAAKLAKLQAKLAEKMFNQPTWYEAKMEAKMVEKAAKIDRIQSKPVDAPAASVGQCPQGHSLTTFQTSHANFTCDVCHLKLVLGACLSGCRNCDWDICEPCRLLSSAHQPSPAPANQPIADEKTAAEAKRAADEKAAAEAKRAADEKAAAEAKRAADEKAAAEAKRAADEKAAAEAKRAGADDKQNTSMHSQAAPAYGRVDDSDAARFAPSLLLLAGMGFPESTLNLFLLKKFNGNLTNVCNWYLDKPNCGRF